MPNGKFRNKARNLALAGVIAGGQGRHLTILYDGASDYLNIAASQADGSLCQSWGIDGIATVPLAGSETVAPGPGDALALGSQGRLLVTGTTSGPGENPAPDGFVARPRRLSKLASKGVTVRARCGVECRIFIRVVTPRKQARKLGLSSPVIAGAERDARAGQTVKLVSRLSKKAKLRLLAANPKVLRVNVHGTADPR